MVLSKNICKNQENICVNKKIVKIKKIFVSYLLTALDGVEHLAGVRGGGGAVAGEAGVGVAGGRGGGGAGQQARHAVVLSLPANSLLPQC